MDEMADARALASAQDRLLRDRRELVRALLQAFHPEMSDEDIEKMVALVELEDA